MHKLMPSPPMMKLAKKYVWWETPEWAMQHPEIFLANAMNLGDWDTFCELRNSLSDDALRQVLDNAPPGYFSYRSWDYWHAVLGYGEIPPLPKRKFS